MSDRKARAAAIFAVCLFELMMLVGPAGRNAGTWLGYSITGLMILFGAIAMWCIWILFSNSKQAQGGEG